MIALKNTTNNQIFYIIHRRMDGEQGWDLMPLNVEYTENGQYSVVPPSGFDGFSSVNVTVDVDQSACNLTTSTVPITENGEHIITPPSGYDGFTEVVVNVDVEGADCETCYDEGVADQKAKLTNTTFTENGNYTREDGWNAVTVNVDTVTPYNNGVADQKAKLTSLNVTQNGTYRREDGYNEVVVNVPSSENCQECYEQGEADQKARLTSATFVNNGRYTLADGWNDVTVNVDTVTPYNNGYNDGVNDQLNRLAPLYVTQNGTYSRPDGYSTVEVNVDCGSYVDVLELDKHQIDVMSSVDEFPVDGLTYQVTLYSSCPWEITGTPYWVSVDQIAGSAGMFIINITVTDFMDNNSGYITFENECGLTQELIINEIDYTEQPLTFKATHSGCLYWKQYGVAYTRPLDLIREDGTVYKTIYSIPDNNGCLVECLDAGDIIRFRSTPTDQQDPQDTYSYFVFADGLRGELYGNLNEFFDPNHSLGSYGCLRLFKDCYGLESVEHLVIPEVAPYYCQGLFEGCTSLTKAMPILPADLATGCYMGMFGSTGLREAPELPATVLAASCYTGMFNTCLDLVKAPALPATNLATECYRGMFRGCTSLTESPFLPSTQLTQGCYTEMFMSCSSLEKITTMMTVQPSSQYTSSWVYGVAANGTFVKNQRASWQNTFGTSAIPQNWTVSRA